MLGCFEAALAPPPFTPFACLADNDLARRVLTFFEGFLVLLVAMICSPSDFAESLSCRLDVRLFRLFRILFFFKLSLIGSSPRFPFVARCTHRHASRRAVRVAFLTRCSRR